MISLFNKNIKDNIKIFSFIWLVVLILSAIFINMQKPYYEAKATYMVNEKSQNPQSFLGGGASAILGISANSENNFLSLELMKSRDVFSMLYENPIYIKNIYAASNYENNSLIYNQAKLDKNDYLKKEFKPSLEDAYDDFHDNIFSFSVSEKTGFIKAKVRHISAIYAKDLLEEFFNNINLSHQRNELKSSFESQDNIKNFIKESTYSNTKMQDFLNKLIENELQDQIILLKDSKLLIKSIDGPIIPTVIAGPNILIALILISIYAFILFLIFCFSLAIYTESIKQIKKNI